MTRISKKGSGLIRHSKIHTGDKLFVCHDCNKGFSNKNSFLDHKIMHTEKQPHTDEMSFVPSEVNMAGCASSRECFIVGDDGHGDIDVGANKIFDSSASNEESSTEKDTDSFKLYGCGICCQSFSTKEETMHCFHSH